MPVPRLIRDKCLINALLARLRETRKAFNVHIFIIFLEEVKLQGYQAPPGLDPYLLFLSGTGERTNIFTPSTAAMLGNLHISGLHII